MKTGLDQFCAIHSAEVALKWKHTAALSMLATLQLIHSDSELTSRKSSADDAKFFLHPFGFDLRVNASTPGEDIVSCQFCAFFFFNL